MCRIDLVEILKSILPHLNLIYSRMASGSSFLSTSKPTALDDKGTATKWAIPVLDFIYVRRINLWCCSLVPFSRVMPEGGQCPCVDPKWPGSTGSTRWTRFCHLGAYQWSITVIINPMKTEISSVWGTFFSFSPGWCQRGASVSSLWTFLFCLSIPH